MTLLAPGGGQLAEVAGVLDSHGAAAPDLTANLIPAGDLIGVAVTITAGQRPSSAVSLTSPHPIARGFQRVVAGDPVA